MWKCGGLSRNHPVGAVGRSVCLFCRARARLVRSTCQFNDVWERGKEKGDKIGSGGGSTCREGIERGARTKAAAMGCEFLQMLDDGRSEEEEEEEEDRQEGYHLRHPAATRENLTDDGAARPRPPRGLLQQQQQFRSNLISLPRRVVIVILIAHRGKQRIFITNAPRSLVEKVHFGYKLQQCGAPEKRERKERKFASAVQNPVQCSLSLSRQHLSLSAESRCDLMGKAGHVVRKNSQYVAWQQNSPTHPCPRDCWAKSVSLPFAVLRQTWRMMVCSAAAAAPLPSVVQMGH